MPKLRIQRGGEDCAMTEDNTGPQVCPYQIRCNRHYAITGKWLDKNCDWVWKGKVKDCGQFKEWLEENRNEREGV